MLARLAPSAAQLAAEEEACNEIFAAMAAEAAATVTTPPPPLVYYQHTEEDGTELEEARLLWVSVGSIASNVLIILNQISRRRDSSRDSVSPGGLHEHRLSSTCALVQERLPAAIHCDPRVNVRLVLVRFVSGAPCLLRSTDPFLNSPPPAFPAYIIKERLARGEDVLAWMTIDVQDLEHFILTAEVPTEGFNPAISFSAVST